jgi:putative flippase GtrA
VLHLNPLVAKLIAVAINFPLGFIGHRTLTFGSGLDGVFAALGRPRPAATERRASL